MGVIKELPDQLIDVAFDLLDWKDVPHEQARLRRAVSTAYYALFHLLVMETANNWGQTESRAAFARLLEHGKMKSVCEKKIADVNRRLKTQQTEQSNLEVELELQIVATAFRDLYQNRSDADYDTAKDWTQIDALAVLEQAESAFKKWRLVRNTPEAQRFLFSFLAKDR